jgi:cytochrome c oxidase cbb3-type subunit 3
MKAWAGLALSLWILSPEQGAAQSSFAVRVLNASPTAIAADAELARFVDQTAAAAIETHCAACHGPDLRGQPGVPDLLDYDWLWGVTGFESNAAGAVMEIQQTLLYGIRDRNCPEEQKSYGACADTRYSEMPAYAELGFDAQTLEDLAAYVLGLSGADADAAAIDRAEAFWPVCIECHAEDGYGYAPYGGPNLTDDIWLYGGSKLEILDVIANGRLGVCPPWAGELDAATIKSLALYIYRRYTGGE